MNFEYTEFDEQIGKAKQTKQIKRTLVEIYQKFIRGEETMGVLSGFEMAAIKVGISLATIEEWYKQCYSETFYSV